MIGVPIRFKGRHQRGPGLTQLSKRADQHHHLRSDAAVGYGEPYRPDGPRAESRECLIEFLSPDDVETLPVGVRGLAIRHAQHNDPMSALTPYSYQTPGTQNFVVGMRAYDQKRTGLGGPGRLIP
jgi:hypothetical protein